MPLINPLIPCRPQLYRWPPSWWWAWPLPKPSSAWCAECLACALAGQSHSSIAERFGIAVADIVRDCTNTIEEAPAGEKEPWLLLKTRYLDGLARKPEASLFVTAADKAHNARGMVLDARRDPAMWSKFNAGLEGSAWYLLRMHQQLSHRMPQSRSTELLGEAVREILGSAPYQRIVPEGIAAAVWAASYTERQQEC
jgi:hypothetical protein